MPFFSRSFSLRNSSFEGLIQMITVYTLLSKAHTTICMFNSTLLTHYVLEGGNQFDSLMHVEMFYAKIKLEPEGMKDRFMKVLFMLKTQLHLLG